MYLSRNAAGSPSCLHVSTRGEIPQYSLFFVYERATKLPLELVFGLYSGQTAKLGVFD